MDEAGEPAAGDRHRARVGAGTASMRGLRLSVAAPWQAGGPQCHVLLALDHLQPVGGAEDGETIAAAPEAGGGAQQPSRYAAPLAQCLQSLGITAAMGSSHGIVGGANVPGVIYHLNAEATAHASRNTAHMGNCTLVIPQKPFLNNAANAPTASNDTLSDLSHRHECL